MPTGTVPTPIGGAGDSTHYALTDHQFSVVALIDSAGNLIERVSYTPYGEARHHWMQDVDGDGDIDATDEALVTAALYTNIYQSGYNVDADFNRDGKVDKQDSALIGSRSFRGALPAGWISSLSVGNVIGFSGYVFNVEIDAGGLYTVRFRHYDPVWGRWISRDPAGYRDSMSLYGYGFGSPLWGADPFGLWWGEDAWDWFKHHIIDGNNPVHEWIADNVWRGVFSDETLADDSNAWWLYGIGIGVSVIGGFVIGELLMVEMGHLFISTATYRAMIAEIGAGASGIARFRWLVANGHAWEMLTYWMFHPALFWQFLRTAEAWPPTPAGVVGAGGVLGLILWWIYEQLSSNPTTTPGGTPSAPSTPTPSGHSGQPLNCPSGTQWPGGPQMSAESAP